MMGHSASSAPALNAPASHELIAVGLAAPPLSAVSAPATHTPTVVPVRLECPCSSCHRWRVEWAAEPDSKDLAHLEPQSKRLARLYTWRRWRYYSWEDPGPHSAVICADDVADDVADPESEPLDVRDLDLVTLKNRDHIVVTTFHFQKWCNHLKAFCFESWWLSSPRARICYLGIHPRSTRAGRRAARLPLLLAYRSADFSQEHGGA